MPEAAALVVVVVAGGCVELDELVVVDSVVVEAVVVAWDVESADDAGFVAACAWWVGCFGGAPALGSDSTYCDTAAGGP